MLIALRPIDDGGKPQIRRRGPEPRGTPIGDNTKSLNCTRKTRVIGSAPTKLIEAFETAGFRTRHVESLDFGTRSSFRAATIPRPARLTDATYEDLSLNADL